MSEREEIIRNINAAILRASREQLCRAVKTIDQEYMLPITYAPRDSGFYIDSIAFTTMQLHGLLEILRAA